jgi:NAD(P)H-flavin reductase
MILLFSNKTKDDILAKAELEEMEKLNSEHFKLFHTLTRHNDELHGEWKGLRGRVTAEMIK